MQDVIQEIKIQIENNSLKLASLPDIIVKVNSAIADNRKGMSEIAKVIQSDISLTTRIIQIVNSPALRGYKDITSMTEALNRLGLTFVKNLALCVAIRDKFIAHGSQNRELLEKEIRLSLLRGNYGFMIAKHLGNALVPEVSLISGLVSLIGNIVIIRYINDCRELKALDSDAVSAIVLESGVEITNLILANWDFPATIKDAVSSQVGCLDYRPKTYSDVFALTDNYITEVHENRRDSTMHQQISNMLHEYRHELASLEATFR